MTPRMLLHLSGVPHLHVNRPLVESWLYLKFVTLDRCDIPLGFQDGRVTRAMLTASSMYNHYYGPWNARLQARNRGQTRGGWIAKYRNRKQWLQVDLGVVTRVKRIATQGRYDANQWVKSYTLSYSNNGIRFIPYRRGRRVQVIGSFSVEDGDDSENVTFKMNSRFLNYVAFIPVCWKCQM